MKRLKTQKGITLVALIITIVVLLILAITSIGAVKDSNIIGHAQSASNKYKLAQEKEQIGLAVSEYQIQKTILADTDGLLFFNTVNGALDAVAEVTKNDDGTLLTVIFDKTGNKYTVDKKGNITKLEEDNDDNDDPITNDFELSIEQTPEETYSSPVSYVTLTIKPIIPDSWKHVYTDDEQDLAAGNVAKYYGYKNSDGSEITTLEQLLIAGGNTMDGLPKQFAKDEYDEMISFMSSMIDADLSTPENAFVFMMGQMSMSYTTVQEWATNIGYVPEDYSIKISEDAGEWIDITNELTLSSLTYQADKNGTYKIQMKLDDKQSIKEVQVIDVSYLGRYVRYDVNGNGIIEIDNEYEKILWKVLRNDADKVELITVDALGNVNIEPTNLDDARNKYNDLVDIMVTECKRVTGITENIRNVGGPAIDATTERVIFRNLTDFKPNEEVDFSQYEATGQNLENGFKVPDNNYWLSDLEQMSAISAIAVGNRRTYCTSCHTVMVRENHVTFGTKGVLTNRIRTQSGYLAYFRRWYFWHR